MNTRPAQPSAAATLFAIATLSGCDQASPPLDAGTEGLIQEITTSPPAPPPVSAPGITFRVRGRDGNAVEGATVRVYTENGPVGTALSDAGGIARVDVPQGRYCATARVVPVEWLELDIIVPETPLEYAPEAPLYGPVVRTEEGWVPFTATAFTDCWQDLPIVHDTRVTEERIELNTGFQVDALVLDLDGRPLRGVDVYAVIPVDVPWRPADLDPEVKTGFLTFVNQSNLPASVMVSPDTHFALEYQAMSEVNGFNLTASAKGLAGGSGTTSTFLLAAAPLMCVETVTPFTTSVAGAGGIDYLQVQAGYHATLQLVPDPGAAAVQIKHAGNGESTIDFHVDLPEGGRTLSLTYGCTNGNCSTVSVKYPEGESDITVQTYFHHLGQGYVKVTAMLMHIPAHRSVMFRARSERDRVPESQEGEGAYIPIDRPVTCSVQSSNDDRWAIGVL